MQEKDEEGAAHDMCDKKPNHYLGTFFRKRWKGIYSLLNMNLLTTDHKPYRHLHHLFLHTYFSRPSASHSFLACSLEAPIFLSPVYHTCDKASTLSDFRGPDAG